MLQEIHAQAEALRTCLATYRRSADRPSANITPELSPFDLPFDLALLPDAQLDQIHLLACGTSRHAALVGQYWLEQLVGIPTRVRSASEFVAAPLPLTSHTLTIAITQSGETADTLAATALQKARYAQFADSLPLKLLGITNHPASSLANSVDALLPTLAGQEIGVAATKTFTTQLMVLACLTLELAYHRQTLSPEPLYQLVAELTLLPQHIETLLREQAVTIAAISNQFAQAQHCILLGRGINRAIALEGALKLKETTYIHAEGYAAGEFLHGPIALVDANILVIALLSSSDPSMAAVVQRVKAHGAPVISIDTHAIPATDCDYHIPLPSVSELLSPFLTVIPLQLLAYHIAVQRGLNVDRPRHLTKTLGSRG